MKTHTILFAEEDRENFERIRNGEKKVETRAAAPKYQHIQEGDSLRFVCGGGEYVARIKKLKHWNSVEDMLKEYTVHDIIPDVASSEEKKERYNTYPDYMENIPKYGLLGFVLEDKQKSIK
jgi:ASC-1-like (ASCH) protein